mgnify:CR=1 FL=1
MCKLFISLFIISSFLSFGTVRAADVATVSGQIRDANDKPLSNATVSIGDKSDFTDVDGRYRIRDVPAGSHKIQVKKKDKVLKEDDIEVKGNSMRQDLSIRY